MRVQSLTLRHYRNYTEQALGFSEGKNIVLGKNGQGKTNLLEALVLLSHSRSHRTSSDRELLLADSDYAALSMVMTPHRYPGEVRLDMQMKRDSAGRLKTVFKLNGTALKNRSQVLGHLRSVSFFNTDLSLLRGSPSDRRRWLDSAITQYDKRHFTYVTDYEKIRKQKSRLLKEKGMACTVDHLAVWNDQLALAGAQLAQSRWAYLRLIHDPAVVRYLELSGEQESLQFHYQCELSETLLRGEHLETLEAAYRKRLDERSHDERQRGVCLVGPHRDDVKFSLNHLDACAYGSQGQQRTLVLALKLTELDLLNQHASEPPILILDDVMAELDPERQQYLMDHIPTDIQVFLTTTHLDQQLNPVVYRAIEEEHSAIFRVSEGCVLRDDLIKINQ